MVVSLEGADLRDFVPTANRYFSSSGQGAISSFGRESPIIRQGSGTGFGISHDFNDSVNVGIGYVANNANNPSEGLFGDRYGAIAQLTFTPTDALAVSATYVRSFNNLATDTGSQLANDPFDDQSDAVRANAWSTAVNLEVTDNFNLGGHIGLIQATATDLVDTPTADIFTWAIQFGFPDLGKESSLLGVVIGQPPKVTSNQFGIDFKDKDTSLHLEAFYRWQLTDHIGITPGLIVILSPDHNSVNDTIYVGTIRTTFRF